MCRLKEGSPGPDYSAVTLETEDLLLKKAQLSDWRDIYENLWRHPESARYMLWKTTASEAEAVARMERTIDYQKDHEYALFIYEKSTGRAIGFAGMVEEAPGVYEETGIALGPDYVGRGYGTQVLNALVEEAGARGAEKFIAACRAQNTASRRLQEKCGFVFSHREDRIDSRNQEPYVLEFREKQLRTAVCAAGVTKQPLSQSRI